MNDGPERAPDGSGRVLPIVFGVVLGLAVCVCAWGATAGAVFGAGAPPVNTAELAHVLATLPNHLVDPRLAWPASTRASLPGPLGFYASLVLLSTIVCLGATVVMRWRGHGHPQAGAQQGASWARRADLVSLRQASRWKSLSPRRAATAPGRMALGWNGRHLLRAEERHALVVFGPPQSGKSAGLAVGALLEWEGPAIASSIKTDLLQATVARRRMLGRVFVFDPFGLSGEPTDTWSPLRGATSFDGALEVAHRLASAGEIDQRSVESGEFWTVAAEQRLAPLLYAAACTGRGVAALVRWAYGQGGHELLDALQGLVRGAGSEARRNDAQAAYDAAAAFAAQPERTRGSIEGTVQALLRVYRSGRVQRSAASSDITPAGLLDGNNTLYLVGDAKASRLLRPIFLALLGELIDHAYSEANFNGGRLRTPLLLCLDELGNVAPVPNLAEIASTAPSHNIQLVSVFHDVAQSRARYGRHAETVINSHRARMLLPGLADLETLRYFSGLVGDQLARDHSRTTGPGYETRSENPARRPLAPPEQLRQLPDGHALLVYGRLPPAIIRLRMWFEDGRLRELADAPS
ncbi:MAG TPA: type IV secretory system conjugative DNA transfer family protein [Solirubrobacteraceae bacterium]